MSQRVQAVLEEFSPAVEPYSIDEMFVRFDGFAHEALLEHARQLRQKVRQFTGIPVCVGVAPTRTLALSVEKQTWLEARSSLFPDLCK